MKVMVKCYAPMKFNDKVKKEKYYEDTSQTVTEAVKLNSKIISEDTDLRDEPVVKSENHDDKNSNTILSGDSYNDDDKSQDSISIDDDRDAINTVKSHQNLPKFIYNSVFCSTNCFQQCEITNQMYFNELNELSKIHLSMADRILSVESRNTWGRSSTVIHSPSKTELKIQRIINVWKTQIETSKFWDTPLMYKCYMCKSAWWRLNDFREHLEEKHSTDQFNCYLEIKYKECNIIANLGTMPAFENFPIDTDCLKCGNNYEFHRQNKSLNGKESYSSYNCNYCEEKFYTCMNYMEHQGDCVEYRKFLKNSRNDHNLLEFYRCLVCKLVFVSKENLRKHYIGVHSVYSDLPMVTSMNVCLMCNVNVVDKLFHNCPWNDSFVCSGCSQSFPTVGAWNLHKAIHNKNFKCRVCNVVLDSVCMEMQHIVSNHSKNFRIVYRCLMCKNNIFLLNELSTKQHSLIWHKKKFDKRTISFELVVVPSKCVVGVEQMDVVTSPCDDAADDNTETSAFANVVLSVKSEKNNETYLQKAFGGDHCSTNEMVPVEVKQEIEDVKWFEDDITLLAQNTAKETSIQTQVETPAKKPKESVSDRKKLKQQIYFKRVKPPLVTSKTTIKCIHCDRESSHFECAKHIGYYKASYKCTKCNVEFVSIEDYFYHFKEHGLSPDCCPVCKKMVEDSYLRHLQQHIRFSFIKMHLLNTKDDQANLLYYCNDCKNLVEIDDFFVHWEGHLNLDKTKPTTSRVRASRSSLEPQLLQRIELILQEKTRNPKQTCIICKINLGRNKDVKKHLIEHLLTNATNHLKNNGGLECQFCSNILAKPEIFRWHMKNHASLPIYKCALCCITFSDSCNFSKHWDLHLKQCDVRQKEFLTEDMRQRHKMMHNAIELSSCEICSETFFNESELRHHVRFKHRQDNCFTCSVCNSKFEYLGLMRDHMWDAHKQSKYKADCPMCKKSFRKFQHVRVHLRTVHSVSQRTRTR